MPRVDWALYADEPIVELELLSTAGGPRVTRRLLADTGAGNARSGFELLLADQDCQSCGGNPTQPIVLGGAYSGSFPVYLVRVVIPILAFDQFVPVVGVTQVPAGLDGIAGFRFLNRFTYGNFGDPGRFGLEV